MKYDFLSNTFVDLDTNLDKIAVFGSEKNLTWGTFRNEVEALKKILTELEIPKGHPVVIYGHQEAKYMVAITALMKSDLPYIPVDTIYPLERLKKIQSVTDSQIIINCSEKKIEHNFAIEINNESIVNLQSEVFFTEANTLWFSDDPLRYIIFTSGSTGEPKGVQITQQAVVSFSEWLAKDYGFTSDDVFLNQAPFSFDLSLYNIIAFLTLGGSICLINKELIGTDNLWDKVQQSNVSVWISTPSFGYMCLRDPQFNSQDIPSLKQFVFIGEALPKNTVNKLYLKFPEVNIVNAYGPTEATVATSKIDVTQTVLEQYDSLPIGFAKRDSELFLVDETATKEDSSEIIISGNHVSIGYFNNASLNAEKFFIRNGKRAFRTGDLGYKKDGILFFNGRMDNQIKFNGYRIELGEISAVIANTDLVKLAHTVPLKRGNDVKAIITFVQLNEEVDDYQEVIKKAIEGKLPSYMIPKSIIALDDFPVNTNHKIDSKQLIENFKKGVYR